MSIVQYHPEATVEEYRHESEQPQTQAGDDPGSGAGRWRWICRGRLVGRRFPARRGGRESSGVQDRPGPRSAAQSLPRFAGSAAKPTRRDRDQSCRRRCDFIAKKSGPSTEPDPECRFASPILPTQQLLSPRDWKARWTRSSASLRAVTTSRPSISPSASCWRASCR